MRAKIQFAVAQFFGFGSRNFYINPSFDLYFVQAYWTRRKKKNTRTVVGSLKQSIVTGKTMFLSTSIIKITVHEQ